MRRRAARLALGAVAAVLAAGAATVLAPVLAPGLILGPVIAGDLAPITSRGPFLRVETGRHEADINGIALLDGGRTAVTVSDDKTARLWTADGLDLLDTLRPPIGPQDQGALYAVATSGDLIAVGGRIGTPDNYAVALFRHMPRAAAPAAPAPASVNPDAPMPRPGSPGGAAPDTLPGAPPAAPPPGAPNVAEAARPLGTISGLPHEISALRFSPGGRMLAVGMQDRGGVRLFDIRAQAALPGDTAYGGSVRGIDFDPAGRFAVSADDGRVRLYGADGRRIAVLALPAGARPWGVAFSPDGRLLAVGDRVRSVVWLIDAGTFRLVRALEGGAGRVGGFFTVAYAPDGAYVVGAGAYNDPRTHRYYARSWSITGRGAIERDIADNIVTGLALVPGGMLFTTDEPAVGRTDATGTVAIRRDALHIDFRNAGLGSFRLSPDGTRIELPAARADGRHIIFDMPARILTLAEAGPGFNPPLVSVPGLSVANWPGLHEPRLSGRTLRLEDAETVRAAAIGPAEGMVAVGTDYFVRLYTPRGLAWRQVVDAPAWAINVTADGRRVVAGLGDGTVHWYNAESGAEEASLFIDPRSGRWVLWTPEGFFDHDHADEGTPDGRTLIGYVQNQADMRAAGFIQIGQLYPSFFRPDLVALSFRDTPQTRALVAAQRLRIGGVGSVLAQGLPPSLQMLDICPHDPSSRASGCPAASGMGQGGAGQGTGGKGAPATLETTSSQVLIDYRLQSPGTVGSAVLRRNAAVIAAPRFTVEDEDHSRTQEATVTLGMGMNVLRLTPVSPSGQIEGAGERSIELRIVRRPPPAGTTLADREGVPGAAPAAPPVVPGAAPPTGDAAPAPRSVAPGSGSAGPSPAGPAAPHVTLYVLSVGVSHFRAPALDLDNAANDARAVADLFRGRNPPVYDDAVVKTLLDDQATAANIDAALHDIGGRAGPDDLVLLFFAGHGEQVDGKYYFAPVEFGTGDPALLRRAMTAADDGTHPLDELFRREGYGQARLLPAIQSIQAARVAVILDTCFSGSLATEDAVLRHDSNATLTTALGHASGRFVLSSATALALDSAGTASGALPSDGQGHGLFTSFLLQALEGAADMDKTGRIDIYKLTMYTTRHVEAATSKGRQEQTPAYFFNGSQFFDLRAVRD